jgi:hypothetical protein
VTEPYEFPADCEHPGAYRYMNMAFWAYHYPIVRRNVRIAARKLLDRMGIRHGAVATEGGNLCPPVDQGGKHGRDE